MANSEQLEYLQDSADDWNVYRREHAITRPDLRGPICRQRNSQART